MENSSVVTSFILVAFYSMEDFKYLYISIFLLLYVIIVVTNLTLMGVIFVDKALHEPMYFFLCNLAANGLYGGTALLPPLLSNLISHTHEVSLACCRAQIYCLHTYAIIEFTILAVMCYDRYIAICYPLQYHSILSIRKVYEIIVFSWCYPLVAFALIFTFTLRLTFCGKVLERVYCINYSLVKLSCVDTTVVNIIGLLSVALYTFPQLIMTIYSYGRILKICIASSKESRLKAVRTCAPHLVAIVNYSVGCFFEILQSRFDTSHLPFATQIFMSLYFLIFPPILNPVIYGLSIKTVRLNIYKLFCSPKKKLVSLM